jgi:transposase
LIRNKRRPRILGTYRLDVKAYKRMRSNIERFFAWQTNGFRRLAIRWKRLASTFTALIQLACVIIYLTFFR